jgi:hypothetical protein
MRIYSKQEIKCLLKDCQAAIANPLEAECQADGSERYNLGRQFYSKNFYLMLLPQSIFKPALGGIK